MSNTVLVVGTGFASTFLLSSLLARPDEKIRVVVIERGRNESLAWKIANRYSVQPHGIVSDVDYRKTFHNHTPEKEWVFNVGLGGGSNVWWGCTPRFLPSDFQMYSRFGVAQDWPVTYGELEPWYSKAEDLMQIAGPSDHTPFAKSSAYPLPPHRLSSVDNALLKAHGDAFFAMPTARASVATPTRAPCCSSGVCFLCPVGARFSITQDLPAVFSDPRVTLMLDTDVVRLSHANGRVSAVVARRGQEEFEVRGDVFCLGANPIFNSTILLRSELHHPRLGRGITEQRSVMFRAKLRALRGLDGGTAITGHHYGWYESGHRATEAACLVETWNVPRIAVTGDMARNFEFKAIFEDLPDLSTRVSLRPDGRPAVHHGGLSSYVVKGIHRFYEGLGDFLRVLGVESLDPATPEEALRYLSRTEGHIIGGTVMGGDQSTSLVNRELRHHQLSNLYILGAGVFPSASPANPSLTIAALSLRAGQHLLM